jgi:hypothetical protein
MMKILTADDSAMLRERLASLFNNLRIFDESSDGRQTFKVLPMPVNAGQLISLRVWRVN